MSTPRPVQETKQVPTEVELDYEDDAPSDDAAAVAGAPVAQLPSADDLALLNSELDALATAYASAPAPVLLGDDDDDDDDGPPLQSRR